MVLLRALKPRLRKADWLQMFHSCRVTTMLQSQLSLERALGLSTVHGRALAASGAEDGCIGFAAGRMAVLYDPKRNTQRFLRATGAVTCLDISNDGSMLAAGQVGFGNRLGMLLCVQARQIVTQPMDVVCILDAQTRRRRADQLLSRFGA